MLDSTGNIGTGESGNFRWIQQFPIFISAYLVDGINMYKTLKSKLGLLNNSWYICSFSTHISYT